MAELERGVRVLLDEAATCLVAVACADPFDVPSEVRLPCLWAADRLGDLEARPRRDLTPLSAAEVPAVLRDALAALAAMPHEFAADPAVADAVTAVRDAVQGLG